MEYIVSVRQALNFNWNISRCPAYGLAVSRDLAVLSGIHIKVVSSEYYVFAVSVLTCQLQLSTGNFIAACAYLAQLDIGQLFGLSLSIINGDKSFVLISLKVAAVNSLA